MEKFTKPELLNFLCEYKGENPDTLFGNSPDGENPPIENI